MTLESLTAVVLNWRTPELATRAAGALLDDGVPPERVVVVDNGSDDGSPERLRNEFPRSVVLALPENVGFARGANAGAAERPGTAYLFVNSDAFVHAPRSVGVLVAALDDPGVGIAVPRLLNEDLTLQPSVVPLSSPVSELVRASGLSRFVPNRHQPVVGTHWDHAATRDVHAAIGAVLLVRATTWDELGGFDERMFMYAEDHDLFWRARRHGWRTRFVADAEFVHLGGGTTGRVWSDAARAERVARAEAALVRAHLPRGRAALTLGLMALGVGVRAVAFRVLGRRDRAAEQAAWLRGYLGR